MELCQGGELFERISERKHYPEPEAAMVCRTLVSVVQHCQSHGVMHRDLKPENILLLSKESNTDVKVVDYGLATFVQAGEWAFVIRALVIRVALYPRNFLCVLGVQSLWRSHGSRCCDCVTLRNWVT